MKLLDRVAARPGLFADATNSFWTDPYVASHVLNAHLDPLTDAASRPPHIITRSARWIREVAGPVPGTRSTGANSDRLLDLGCGPGLYAVELTKLGFQVTGVDFSINSIRYARTEAAREGHSISYRCEDYRNLEDRDAYEVATLIYGEFGVFSDVDRDTILRKVRAALVPGGYFIFDVFTERYADRTALKDGWYVSMKDGFWSDRPHFVLERTHRYPEHHVNADRYVIVMEDGTVRDYNIWKHYYDRDALESLLEKAGFTIDGVWGDLCGEPYSADGEWIGVIARKA